MIRLVAIVAIVGFVLWLISPFLKKRTRESKTNNLDKILEKKQRTLITISFYIIPFLVVIFVIVTWILPKLGINTLGLLQKILLMISSLRAILPF